MKNITIISREEFNGYAEILKAFADDKDKFEKFANKEIPATTISYGPIQLTVTEDTTEGNLVTEVTIDTKYVMAMFGIMKNYVTPAKKILESIKAMVEGFMAFSGIAKDIKKLNKEYEEKEAGEKIA